MNSDAIEAMVRYVLGKMNSLQGPSTEVSAPANSASAAGKSGASVSDYPLANKHPDWVKTATNKTLQDITLESVLAGKITAQPALIARQLAGADTRLAQAVAQ